MPSCQIKAKCSNISGSKLVRRFRDLFITGGTSAPSDSERMQCDISGEPRKNLQPYLQCMILQWQTQLLSLLLWRLPSRSYSDFCWYFAPVGGSWPAKREIFPGELPSFRRLQQAHPSQDAREQRDGCSEPPPLSDDPMFHLFPFGAVSGDLGLETSFFPGRQGWRGAVLLVSWIPQRQLLHCGCSHSGRNGLAPTFLLYAVYGNAAYSKTFCWLSHHRPLHQGRTALNI